MKKRLNNRQSSENTKKQDINTEKTSLLTGNEILGKLLEYCSQNNISVQSYFWGQNEGKISYIIFKVDEQSINVMIKMLKFLNFDKSILYLRFIKNPKDVFSLGVYITPERANEGFDLLFKILKNKEEVMIDDLNISRQLMLKALINHVVPESWIEIQEGKDVISIAVDPEYSNIYPISIDVKPWSGNSVMANFLKDTDELMDALRNLESRTKNYKFLLNHPYKQKNLDEILRAENITMKMNPEKTSKRKKKSGESRVLIFETNEETNIETLANEMMKLPQYGYACITTFGQFEIDTRDYNNPEEIVTAYKRSLEPKREFKESLDAGSKTNLWMDRFRIWHETIDKKSENIKSKFVKMKSELIRTIREKTSSKSKTKERD